VVVGDQIQKNVRCGMCQGDEECVRNLKGERHRCVDNIMNRIDKLNVLLTVHHNISI
jgi:hypothetical protein